ncbi:MAG: tRNA uridine(34) 5-carboxymethylaminomethyl modification radical SAM/GNAT enzyme Elp3 [Methanobacteriota archaeon]
MTFHSDITRLILTKKIQTKDELHKEKIRLCKKYHLTTIPPDSEILACLPTDSTEEEKQTAYDVLRKKPMRTISGVTIIAVMTSPEPCPHGRCLPCPGGPEKNTPQSYTGYEPAAMRAIFHDFNPYYQVTSRLEQLHAIGHPTDKIDLILMGGTFTARLPDYQQWFVKRCFDALNQKQAKTLTQAQHINETAHSRCIGLTVETRPDWFRLFHADTALYLGATRVELGVQTVYDDILYGIKRGHTVSDSIAATRVAKECGFKVCYHMMPGLPGSTPKKDLEVFRIIFEDQRFKPDMIKIYPTLITKDTRLYDLWKTGTYKPYTLDQTISLIAQIKQYVPEWVRIQRIQRDIPVPHITAGVKKGNLRQLVNKKLQTQGKTCRCIRCREIGHRSLKQPLTFHDDQLILRRYHYEASGGTEIFLSLEDKRHDVLVGFIRIRDLMQPHRYELLRRPSMIIRELKILGRELSIGEKQKQGMQHKGYGKELVHEAERICVEDFDKKTLVVLSGIGVKAYYRKLGFSDDGVYLSKYLKK